MHCTDPLTEGQILRLLADDGEPAWQAHLATCAACSQRLADLAAFEGGLRRHFWRSDCPSAHELGELRFAHLNQVEITKIQAHLALCPHCRAELAQLDQFMQPLPQVRRAQRVELPSLGLGGFMPLASGLRGDLHDGLRYTDDDLQVELEMLPSSHRQQFDLLGMVIDPQGLLERAELYQADQVIQSTALAADGSFQLDAVASGRYQLRLSGAKAELVIDDLLVGE